MRIRTLVPALLLVAGAWAPAAGAERGAADGAQPAAGRVDTYADIVERVGPSVVTVFSSRTRRDGMGPGVGDLEQLPPGLREFFGRGGPGMPERQQQGLGSGVIISADGYILTNHHVVRDADEIRVRLANNYDEFPATVVGSDAKSDLAVLRIEPGSTTLRPIAFADSAQARVGDIVLAVGNPMGVGQTVTQGIVSALNRGVGIVDYEDFIQTDAAINVGNSGGALVTSSGELLGINTAILSRSGGSIGIGFAVPSNLARSVFEQIVKSGRVTRGFLGVMIQPVTPELARAMKLQAHEGALVGDVTADSPAAKAGLQAGDVITGFAGEPVRDPRQLRLRVAATAPGTEVPLTIVRQGGERQLTLSVGELPGEEGTAATDGAGQAQGGIGVRLQDLDEALRRRFDVPQRIAGALITEVRPDSRAARAGLREGDVIHEVNGTAVDSAAAAARAIRGTGQGATALLRVWSEGGSRFVAVPAGQ